MSNGGGLGMQGLDEFLKSNPRGVESIGTSEPAVRSKTQLMALLGLATTESHVSYAKIQVPPPTLSHTHEAWLLFCCSTHPAESGLRFR